MKGRESGMPDEAYWDSFFDADRLVEILVSPHARQGDVVEFGSGYGTFTISVAKKILGIIYGFDIENDLIALVAKKCERLGLENVRLETRDFVDHGTGLPDSSIEHVMIFNILHIEHPVVLLKEAFRILKPGATASVIHWRCDIVTPRGPSMEIRPSPEQCMAWAQAAGFTRQNKIDISACCPYHFGLLVTRPLIEL